MKYTESVNTYDSCSGVTQRNTEFVYFLHAWGLLKVWSPSGGFLVALSTRRLKEAPIVWHVLTSEFRFSAASPLEVDTVMK